MYDMSFRADREADRELDPEPEWEENCPVCKTKLLHKSIEPGIPEHLYCPVCLNWAYVWDSAGKLIRLTRLE